MNNIKKWLTNISNLKEDEITSLDKAATNKKPFKEYKIIKWHHDHEVDHQTQIELLRYVESGGICKKTVY